MVRRRRRRQRAATPESSNPFEFAERRPAPVEVIPAAPTCEQTSTCEQSAVPKYVHHLWLGGGKLMFAKLFAILSVRYALKPQRHFIHYDVEPNDAPEWKCACKLATCVQIQVPLSIHGHRIESKVDPSDRYASDRQRRCANALLDVLKFELLLPEGGMYLDLDVYALGSLDPWRCCAPSAVFGWNEATRQLSGGVILASRGAEFLRRWHDSFRAYSADNWDFGVCNQTTALAAAHPTLVHAAAPLGPLPRYRTREGYDAHIARAAAVHLSQFRHPWRLHDIMNHRHLERLWERVAPLVNASGEADISRTDPVVRRCVETVASACWARPGGRCGIYGA